MMEVLVVEVGGTILQRRFFYMFFYRDLIINIEHAIC